MHLEHPAEEAVCRLLRSRASHGTFRSFSVRRLRGQLAFSFVWLRERPFRLVFNADRSRLEFRDVLPNLPAKEPMYKDLRRFVKGRCDAELPEHRRIAPERLRVKSRNRKGSVTLSVESLDADWDYAVSKALKFVNEVFLGFLRGPYHEYMVKNLGEPED